MHRDVVRDHLTRVAYMGFRAESAGSSTMWAGREVIYSRDV